MSSPPPGDDSRPVARARKIQLGVARTRLRSSSFTTDDLPNPGVQQRKDQLGAVAAHNRSKEEPAAGGSRRVTGGAGGKGGGGSAITKPLFCPLEQLLAQTEGLNRFRRFLEKEHSSENVQFWLAVERFKRVKGDQDIIQSEAEKIFETFLSTASEKEVNVPAHIQQPLAKKFAEFELVEQDVFDAAQRNIFSLMEIDSYSRFRNTDDYKDLIERYPELR